MREVAGSTPGLDNYNGRESNSEVCGVYFIKIDDAVA
jgi:hypothetical protein